MIAEVIIPARMASTRLPGKMLLDETGKTLIQHTYEAASRAKLPARFCVATDHEDILCAVEAFGGQAVMTDVNAPSGTDRVAEAAQHSSAEIIVNVQGDEPEIEAAAIDLVIDLLVSNPDVPMATLATPIRSKQLLNDPAAVKVVRNLKGEAIYFSRSVIPHPRMPESELQEGDFLLHIGLYAYRRDFLFELTQMGPTRLEQIEKLEQLRVLEHGHRILVGIIDSPAVGIDTAEDYRAFVTRTRNG